MARTLCELYAMMSAFQIRAYVGVNDGVVIKAVTDREDTENHLAVREMLPKWNTVQKAVRDLFAAVASEDKAEVSSALEEMGVLALCPIPEQQFSRMELAAGCVAGRAQVIPLVELSLFALELRDYERAAKYAQEAHAFDPESWELYNLCVVEGLIALNAGKIGEAIQCLASSIRACQRDEHALLECGVRVPNLLLAEKLLESGERVEVLRHLLDCRDIWQFLKPQIDELINLIEHGERQDFRTARILGGVNSRSSMLKMQWLRACSLNEGLGKVSPKSPAAAMAGRELLRAGYKVHRSATIKSRIQYLDKDLTVSPDQPSPNPAEPDEPE